MEHHPEPHDGHGCERPWDYPHYAAFAHHCADHCDDQLPLFSQVGRGLQGDGYVVDVIRENNAETFLEGMVYDPHSGAYEHDWYSHNVNGGEMIEPVIELHPETDPKSFKMTFELNRPDYDDEYPGNGDMPLQKGWIVETPAIPYLSEEDFATRVRSLFLRSTNSPSWNVVKTLVPGNTPHSIDDTEESYEKLVYTEGKEREESNAPLPGDPETVNLTFGKGGDIDCPTTDEEEADIQAVLTHLHQDLYGGDYANIPSSLKPLMGDTGGQASVWDWIKYARDHIMFTEGSGIDITEVDPDPNNNGKRNVTISADVAKISAGPGVKVTKGTGGNHVVESLLSAGSNVTIENVTDQSTGNVSKKISVSVNNPEIYTSEVANLWLVSYKPAAGAPVGRELSSNTALANWLAAVPITFEVEYFDSLPTVYVNMTTATSGGVVNPALNMGANAWIYGGADNLRLGTGEIAVVCTKAANDYIFTPVDLKSYTIFPDRPEGFQKIKYPPVNPETLINSGYGFLVGEANLVTTNPYGWSFLDYPGEVFGDTQQGNGVVGCDVVERHSVHYESGTYHQAGDQYTTLQGAGTWEVYAGLGNVKHEASQNSRVGGWMWVKQANANSPIFAYLFNRSVGNVGVRVRIDNARTYSVTYSQATPHVNS